MLAYLPVLAGSAVIAALVSGWISLRNSARVIQAQYITAQRAKWRDRVRCVALNVHRAAVSGNSNRLAELLLELTLFLNPKDPMDGEILDLVRKLRIFEKAQPPPCEFGERIALLLKHDWDRSKWEAQPFFRKVVNAVARTGANSLSYHQGAQLFFRRVGRPPDRVSYEEFAKAETSRRKPTTAAP